MSCYICVDNGLGDKLLDVIGFYIICKYLNYNPHIILNKYVNNYAWGHNKYDPRLFKFTDIIITEQECENYINSPNPSSSLCPYKVYTFINKYKMVSFEQISNDYNIYAKTIIQPSEIINSKIPIDIEKAYGIHLRKTDKVKPSTDSRFENSMNEFDIIMNSLLNDINKIIETEDNPILLIVSEDEEWKKEIKNKINNNKVKFIEINYENNVYDNYKSVLDMFCLSKCKEILQGVKYSTFSMLAGLLGNNKIRNYSNKIESNYKCLIHTWSSAIEINNTKNYHLHFHDSITKELKTITTSIRRPNIL